MFIDRAFDEMNKKDKIVIGFELGNSFSQVSYCMPTQSMPDTFSFVVGEEQYNISTVLCRKKDVQGGFSWVVGKDAIHLSKSGQGTLVEDLVLLAKNSVSIRVGDEEFEAEYLLEIFVKKVLNQVLAYVGKDDIAVIAFTLKDMNTTLMEMLKRIVSRIRKQSVEVIFCNHEDCFFQYIIHQPQEMWIHDVILYDYRNDGIHSQILQMNRKTNPVACFVETENFPQMKMHDMHGMKENEKEAFYKQLDEALLEILKNQCEGRLISSIFLLGDNFANDWCKESLRYMCKGRRVFQGNNLFSKGACYAAREKNIPSTLSNSYIYLSNEKLRANIGMVCDKGREEIYLPILNAGTNWYEAKAEFDVMLVKNNIITLTIVPIDGGKKRIAKISLEGLKVRGNKTNRINLKFYMDDNKSVKIEIEDKGFGELFPSSGQVWKECLPIETLM